MTATLSKACSRHDEGGTKVIFEADGGKGCPLCEAEKKIASMREAISQVES